MSIIGAFLMPHPPLIIPDIGRGEETVISSTYQACEKIVDMISDLQPETVVISSPHGALYSDRFSISSGTELFGDMSSFGASRVKLRAKHDSNFADALCRESNNTICMHSKLDHGSFIPLWFLQEHLSSLSVVSVRVSGLSFDDHFQFGKMISKVAKDLGRKTVFIASGDMSHKLSKLGPYGHSLEGVDFDRKICEILHSLEFNRLLEFNEDYLEKAAECGLRSAIMMAGSLDGKDISGGLLSYEGPFGVGYATAAYAVKLNNDLKSSSNDNRSSFKNKTSRLYVNLARNSLESFIKTGKQIEVPKSLPHELFEKKAGVFVTLKINGELRGCIGTIAATRSNVVEEIIQNAISAGTKDPRFPAVKIHELDSLEYSVDVLSPPESVSSIEELDVHRYGIIITSGFRRGLLLPNLEGIDTPMQQVEIVARKAGIHPDEDYFLERFEVIRHVESD